MELNGCEPYNKVFVNLTDSNHADLVYYYSGRQACPPMHYWTGLRNHYLIHYILSGKGVFTVNENTYSLGKGQGFLICPGSPVYYRADEEDPWEYCWVGFNGVMTESYLKQVNMDKNYPVFTYGDGDRLEKVISEMETVNCGKTHNRFYAISLLYKLFSLLAEELDLQIKTEDKGHFKELYFKKSVEFIQKNYSSRINIADLAEYIGINRKYLFSIFKEYLNVSPQGFLIHYRIDRACELMRDRRLSIEQISYSVGYEDPLLFSKMFKKVKLVSPRDFRSRLL